MAEPVAVYVRWSTDDQSAGTTLEVQLDRCRHFVLAQGWEWRPDLVYVDDGISGGTLERPALTRLRADVAAGRVQGVVVYKLDRLSRSVADIVQLVLREWDGRCFIKSATEEINTGTPGGKMFFYLLVSFAEYERSLIRERTLLGKQKRAEQGRNPGFRPPYGFARGEETGSLVVVPAEADVVRRVFAWYVGGWSPAAVARRLGADGVTYRGRPWSPLAVRRLLANPAVAGVLAYGRTRAAGALPALVDPPLWQAAERLLAERAAARHDRRRPTYSDYVLSGIARCGGCGAPVQGKRAGGRAYYACTARKRSGAAACAAGHMAAAPLEALLGAQAVAVTGVGAAAWARLTVPERRRLLQTALRSLTVFRPVGSRGDPAVQAVWTAAGDRPHLVE